LFAPLGAAQPAESAPAIAPLKDTLTGSALEAYDSARMLLGRADYPGAMAKFQQAYGLSKDPRLLYDMALCARDMRTYARMQNLLVRFEQEGKEFISPETRHDLDAALDAIRNLVGSVTLTVSEAGASVWVDGDPVGESPLPVPLALDLGKHTVSVRKEGFDVAERRIEVFGGNDERLMIVLAARARLAQLVVAGGTPAASIVIDHREIVRERYDGIVSAGVHEVQVSAPGKKAYEARVELHDGETRTMNVTLEDERRPPRAVWPWILGGAAVVVAGATVGGYFLFRQQPAPVLGGTLNPNPVVVP
jgi:hypothetical protein